MFGAIFYRLLFRSSPLTEEFSDKLVRQSGRCSAVPELERAKLPHVPNLAGSNRRDFQSDNQVHGPFKTARASDISHGRVRMPVRLTSHNVSANREFVANSQRFAERSGKRARQS